MSLEQLTLTDEQVQDIVGSLINGSSNADVVYDDANGTLTVSLPDSISVNTLEANGVIENAVYQSPADIPTKYEENGNQAYTESDGLVVFEQ